MWHYCKNLLALICLLGWLATAAFAQTGKTPPPPFRLDYQESSGKFLAALPPLQRTGKNKKAPFWSICFSKSAEQGTTGYLPAKIVQKRWSIPLPACQGLGAGPAVPHAVLFARSAAISGKGDERRR